MGCQLGPELKVFFVDLHRLIHVSECWILITISIYTCQKEVIICHLIEYKLAFSINNIKSKLDIIKIAQGATLMKTINKK